MMAFVFRPKRKGRVSRTYVARYRLEGDLKPTRVRLGVTDKQLAWEKLRQIVREAERERLGVLAPKNQREAALRPIVEHVEKFVADRRALRRDEKYVRELRRKLLRLVKECSWRTATDVTGESFCSWRLREAKSAKTLNEYLNAVSAFTRWLARRIGMNPLGFVEKVERSEEPRRLRRALSEAELQRLIQAGGRRGIVYLVAARTGIRRGELEQIEWRDVHLEAKQPFILVRASVSKNHRQAMQPLVADACSALLNEKLSCEAGPGQRVFTGLIPRIERFKRDLEVAGILYQDGRGEYADFHSLRKTFGTMLTLAGVGLRTVMELMRHSDMRLTAKTYTDANMLPISDAMVALQRFAEQVSDAPIDALKSVASSQTESTSVKTGEQNAALLGTGDEVFSLSETASVPTGANGAQNARCRVRTCDFLRVKQALYH